MAENRFDDDQTGSFTNLAASIIVSHYIIISGIDAGDTGNVYLARNIGFSRRTKLPFR